MAYSLWIMKSKRHTICYVQAATPLLKQVACRQKHNQELMLITFRYEQFFWELVKNLWPVM